MGSEVILSPGHLSGNVCHRKLERPVNRPQRGAHVACRQGPDQRGQLGDTRPSQNYTGTSSAAPPRGHELHASRGRPAGLFPAEGFGVFFG